METTATPANMTPAQIDTELARLSTIEWTAWRRADEYRGYAARTRLTIGTDYAAKAVEQEAIAASARKEARPYHLEYAQRPWNRYFLVTNTNGHVHRGMNCGTCFQTTEYAWLVDLADCDEAAMVAEYGEMACTVCFPAAPTYKGFADGTSTHARRTQAEKDARQAEKDERAAKKAAKALLAPVRTEFRGRIETVTAAQQALRDLASNTVYYGPRSERENADRDALTAALVAKGFTPEDVATLEAKATKKATKELAASQARFAATGSYV